VSTPPIQDFKPLSFLPMVRSNSEGQLADLRTLLASLKAGRAKPHVFDDATIERVIRVHTETLTFLPYTRRQLDRWKTEHPSAAEQQMIQIIRAEVDETEKVLHEVLALAREISVGTVEKVLGMSEFEVALAALAGKRPGLEARVDQDLAANTDPEGLAAQIDARMAELAAAGLDDTAIFTAMVDHLPAVALMDEDMLDSLCRRHAGLDRYVCIVEAAVANAMTVHGKPRPRR
jgi:hypothetical protein